MVPLLLAAAVPSILKGISGIADIFGGNRRAKNNIRPITQVNENYQKNVDMAESMGRTGLPSEQYNRSFQNIGRNQAVALNALGRSSNPSAGINSLLRGSNDAVMGLDAQDANARLQNQRFAFGQRSALAQEQQRVWDWNKKSRYQEEANVAGQQIGSGKQNIMGALNNLSSLGQTAYGAYNGQQNGAQQVGSDGYISHYLPNAVVEQPQQYSMPMNRYYSKFKF